MRSATIITALTLVASAASHKLTEVLALDPQLSVLLGAINSVPGLAQTLNEAQGITLFAPLNDAFEAVAGNSLEGEAIAEKDIQSLTSLLSYHVATSSVRGSDITTDVQFVKTLLTSKNTFAGQPATLVADGQRFAAQIIDGKPLLTSGLLTLSTVLQTDIAADNAIIHKIDKVLTIPRNASATASNSGFNGLVDALLAAEHTDAVDNYVNVTIFIPTNDAFKAVEDLTKTLTAEQITAVLDFHVASNVLYSPDIHDGETKLPTLNPADAITVTKEDGAIHINKAQVTSVDVLLRNGVGHIIDGVLIPAHLNKQGP